MEKTTFNPFPALASERLTLRQLTLEDDVALFSLRSDDEVNRYIGRLKQTNIEEVKVFIQGINDEIKLGNSLYWAICLKGSGDLIGTICLWNFSEDKTSAELGYELFPRFQGRGFMGEAVKSVLDYGFVKLGLQTLYASTHKDNIPSRRVLEKNNFSLHNEKDGLDLNEVAYRLSGSLY